jgi:ATP-dependent RNA helicase MSS116
MVILDEADQLLDLGFKPAIDQIFASLPKADKRQTLLFSATVPQSVRDIASTTLKPGYAFLDTVGEQDAEQTHSHVPQELVIMQKMSDLIPTIAGVLQKQMNLVENYKILVFFNTARVAGFMADMFKAMRWPVIEMHSRMSQGARTKASDAFRASDRVIMFSSDVSARGMDYPGVSFVLQVGSTEKAQYIHRLGRTARAGKEGAGMLLLQAFEERAMKNELKGLPLRHIQYLDTTPSLFTTKYQPILANVNSNAELKRSAEQAFQSWLGYYNGKLRALGWSKLDLVRFANDFCRSCGLNEMPSMDPKIVGKMGLKGTPGLRISPSNR